MAKKSERSYGYINFDELINGVKSGKISTHVSDAGVRFIDINIWRNAEPDQFGNDGSIQLQYKKEYMTEKKIYIGNFRKHVAKEVTPEEIDNEVDDLPF